MITVEQDQQWDEALQARREAEEHLQTAISRMRSAATAWLSAEAALADDPHRILVGHAYSNRSTWSGGVTSASNIQEAILREAAIELLKRGAK